MITVKYMENRLVTLEFFPKDLPIKDSEFYVIHESKIKHVSRIYVINELNDIKLVLDDSTELKLYNNHSNLREYIRCEVYYKYIFRTEGLVKDIQGYIHKQKELYSKYKSNMLRAENNMKDPYLTSFLEEHVEYLV